MIALAACGWALALVLAVLAARGRRRLELVGDADHELRGPVTALALALEGFAREPSGRRPEVSALATELARLRAGLDDLAAARRGIRRVPPRESVSLRGLVGGSAAGWVPAARRGDRRLTVDWRAGEARVEADRGRLGQVFGNLLANAVEHGSGTIELRGERVDGAVRVEVRNDGVAREVSVAPTSGRALDGGADRGRGLRIARRAVEDAGGLLRFENGADGARAAVELPLADR